MNRDAVIVSSVRTAVGKYGGALASVPDYVLGGTVIREAVTRAGIDPAAIDDVYFGNLLGIPGSVARVAALMGGVPAEVPAVTVDRQCASSLETLAISAAMIRGGFGDLYLAGGCENMTNRPYMLAKQTRPYAPAPPQFLGNMFVPPAMGDVSMGETAENVLEQYPFSREELDAFAYQSHVRALKAQDEGIFNDQIVPVETTVKKATVTVDIDECPRRNTSMELLSKLRPLFKAGGSVTAGNSCPMNDGAAAQIVMSRERVEQTGLKPLASIKAFAFSGLDYKVMGLGPIHATRKLLSKIDIPLDAIGLIELNEAFSSQSLACIQELKFNPERVNVNGGAIALGHPLAATGSILVTKMIYEMHRRNERYGLVTMCIGGGQGAAMLLEKEG